jgi:hypothetical protein
MKGILACYGKFNFTLSPCFDKNSNNLKRSTITLIFSECLTEFILEEQMIEFV